MTNQDFTLTREKHTIKLVIPCLVFCNLVRYETRSALGMRIGVVKPIYRMTSTPWSLLWLEQMNMTRLGRKVRGIDAHINRHTHVSQVGSSMHPSIQLKAWWLCSSSCVCFRRSQDQWSGRVDASTPSPPWRVLGANAKVSRWHSPVISLDPVTYSGTRTYHT